MLRVTDRVADAGPAQPARWFVLQAAYNFCYKALGVRRGTLRRSQSGGLYRRSLTRPRRTVRRSQPGGFYYSPPTRQQRTVLAAIMAVRTFLLVLFPITDATASPGSEADTAAWRASDCWRACSMGCPACHTTVTARSAAQHSRRAPHTQLANLWQAQRSRRAPQEAGRGCAAGATAASTSLTLHSCRYFSDFRRCVMSPAHRWCALAAPLPPSCRPRSALGRPVNTQILVLARDMGPLAPWCYTWLLYLDKTGNVDPVIGAAALQRLRRRMPSRRPSHAASPQAQASSRTCGLRPACAQVPVSVEILSEGSQYLFHWGSSRHNNVNNLVSLTSAASAGLASRNRAVVTLIFNYKTAKRQSCQLTDSGRTAHEGCAPTSVHTEAGAQPGKSRLMPRLCYLEC